jgi:hypothetical protein
LRQHAQGLDGNVKHTKRSLVVALTVLALFVCAGTHENEIAGILAAYWLIEKSRVHGAKLFVMPRANAAGAAWSSQNSQSPRIL